MTCRHLGTAAAAGALLALVAALPASARTPVPASPGAAAGQTPAEATSDDTAETTFEYVYAEANEGGSSGGHAAIRFGDRVYHFQNEGGLLVVDREETSDFFHDYALVDNRPLHLSRVAVDARDARRLRAQFERRYRIQHQQLDVLAALREDEQLLAGWREAADGGDPARAAPEIPALGYFADRAVSRAHPAAAVALLRRRIEARHGAGFLARRRAAAGSRLAEALAADPAAWEAPPPGDVYQEPPFSRSFARHYRDAASEIAALEVLAESAPLAEGALVEPAGPEYWLERRERDRLLALRAALEERLVTLAGSARSDWGGAFLVGLARLLTLDACLEQDRLVLLDVVPADARTLPARVVASRPGVVAQMARAGRDRVEAARSRLMQTTGVDERGWARLEGAANRLYELDRAVREGRDLRLARGVLLPARARRLETALPRRSDAAGLARDLERVRERERRDREGLERLYRYHLLTRNCVSELFATLNDAMGDDAGRSRAVLGGYIDGHASFTFIPFVSAAAVDDRYRVVERRTLPSQRETRLREMRRRENPLWVALRESNTLTARSYGRGTRDSFFLFFTDDTVVLRPIFGALNLTAALGESLWGLVRLPVDRGDTLVSGLQGALTSLPELVFGNIRKGSNDWVPRGTVSVDD